MEDQVAAKQPQTTTLPPMRIGFIHPDLGIGRSPFWPLSSRSAPLLQTWSGLARRPGRKQTGFTAQLL